MGASDKPQSKRFVATIGSHAIPLITPATTALLVAAAGAIGVLMSRATDIAETAAPAVVRITALDADADTTGYGSGFVVASDGTIVTNYHVIEGARGLLVALASGERFSDVFIVETDSTHDIAILKVRGSELAKLDVRSDRSVRTGHKIYTMGNPLGMERTFADGIVSGRHLRDGIEYLQITAPLSAGSSGGPVMDTDGKVVGVATAGIEGGENLNLAVPSRYLLPLIESQSAPRPFAEWASTRGGLPAAAAADSTARFRQVLSLVEYFAAQFGNLESVGEATTGQLADDATQSFTVTLTGGENYRLAAACDVGCKDLDLAIMRDGSTVSADTLLDDFPIVAASPPETASYDVVVSMADCKRDKCAYAIGLFRAKR